MNMLLAKVDIIGLERRGFSKSFRKVFLVLVAICVSAGIGWSVIHRQMLPILLVFAALGGAGLLFVIIPRNPFGVFLLWLGLGAFFQPYNGLELGAGIPNLTFARALVYSLGIYLILRTLARTQDLVIQGPDFFVILFSIYYLVALYVTAPDLRQEMLNFESFYVLPFLVYFLTRALVRHSRHLEQISQALLLAGVVLAGLGVYEHFAGKSLLTPWSQPLWSVAESMGSLRSAAATLGNPSIYGCFMAMVFSLNLHFFALARDRAWKMLYGISLVLNVVASFFSYRRASWLALAVVLVIHLVGHRQMRWRLAIVLIILLSVAGFSWSSIAQTPFWRDRVLRMSSIQDRLDLYDVQGDIASGHLLLGSGIGTVRGALVRGGASHDTFMTLLLDGGLLIVLLYLLPLLVVCGRSIANSFLLPQQGVISRGLTVSLLGALAAYLLTAVTLDMRFFTFLACVFWMFVGILWQLPEIEGLDRTDMASLQGG